MKENNPLRKRYYVDFHAGLNSYLIFDSEQQVNGRDACAAASELMGNATLEELEGTCILMNIQDQREKKSLLENPDAWARGIELLNQYHYPSSKANWSGWAEGLIDR